MDDKAAITAAVRAFDEFLAMIADGDWAEVVSVGGMIIVSHGLCFRSSALKK